MTGTGTYRRQYGRGHAYYIDDIKVPGVTTIIGGGLPKPALVKWAATEVANRAVDEWDQLAELPTSQRLKRLVSAPDDVKGAAGVRGTRVHQLAEPLALGQEVPVPPDLTGHVEACVAFLDAYRVVPILTEVPVFHRRYMYGGSPDLIADAVVPGQGRQQRILIDWKTNRKGPYGDMAFQLAAYRYAQFYIDAVGAEQPMPDVDACWVVWLRADGYDVYPMHADGAVFRQFLYIQQVAEAAAGCRDYKGDPLITGVTP